jgi:hypothetical protein
LIDIVRTFDYDLVDSILNLPELLETIAPKKLDKPFKTPRDEKVFYLTPVSPEGVIGVFIIHQDTQCSYKIHANIMIGFRRKYSEEACEKVVQWVWDNIDTDKLNCDIPCIYKNVVDRALAVGFEIEGIRKKVYLKDNKALDLVMLGIERPI